MSNEVTPTPQQSWLVRGVAVVVGIGVLAVALPAIYFAFLSALGLLGIGITAVIGIAAFKALPLLSQKWENRLLGARISEARQSPVEQILNRIRQRTEQLQAYEQGLVHIGGQIRTQKAILDKQAKADPGEDFSQQYKDIADMQTYFDDKKIKYKESVDALEAYKKAFERAKFKFEFGNAAAGIKKAMNANDEKAMVEDMLADEAFKAIDARYNSAFAALDVESSLLTSAKQIEFRKGVVLDVKAIEIPILEPMKVKA